MPPLAKAIASFCIYDFERMETLLVWFGTNSKTLKALIYRRPQPIRIWNNEKLTVSAVEKTGYINSLIHGGRDVWRELSGIDLHNLASHFSCCLHWFYDAYRFSPISSGNTFFLDFCDVSLASFTSLQVKNAGPFCPVNWYNLWKSHAIDLNGLMFNIAIEF